MTRYAIDALAAIRLIREGLTVPEEHQLVAPKSLQSHAMAQLYREVASIVPIAPFDALLRTH